MSEFNESINNIMLTMTDNILDNIINTIKKWY